MMERARRCPEEVLAAIPWYPDAGIDAAEIGAVEAHAAGCAECRREIALVLGEEAPSAEAPPADALFARVMERVRESERAAAVPAARLAPAAAGGLRRPASRGRLARAAAIAALALACAGLGALAGRLWSDREARYETAAFREGPAALSRPLLDVVFREDVEAQRIHSALRAIQGEIAGGPSEVGRYRVQLPPGADAAAAARALGAEGSGVAVFAEPVQP